MKQKDKPVSAKAPLFSFRFFFRDHLILLSAIPALLIWRPRLLYENLEAKKRIRGGALLVANHSSFFDPIYTLLGVWYRRQHFLVAKEVMGKGLRALFFTFSLCISVDRENLNFSFMKKVVSYLKKGEVVTLFPSGHISQTASDELSTFKSGVILMALQSGCPIVPLYIHKRDTFWQRLTVCIGEAIPTDELCPSHSPMPTMAELEQSIRLIQEKEIVLKHIYESFMEDPKHE